MSLLTVDLAGLRLFDARQYCPSEHEPVSVHRKHYVVIHESVTDPDQDTIEAIKAISSYHQQYGGIGYNCIVDKRGNLYYVGEWNTERAGAAQAPWINAEAYHICMLGKFDLQQPPLLQLRGVRQVCAHLDKALGRRLCIVPHAAFNTGLDYWRSKYNCSCPGATWPQWWGHILPYAEVAQ